MQGAILYQKGCVNDRGPYPAFASMTVPCALRFGLALRSAISAVSSTILEQVVNALTELLAEMLQTMV